MEKGATIKTARLLEEFPELLTAVSGGEATVERIGPLEDCRPGDIVFVNRSDYVEAVLERRPTAVVTTEELSPQFKQAGDLVVFSTHNVNLAHALVRQRYADRDLFDDGWERIHPSAVIHESVEVPERTRIGPNSVIGRDVILGDFSVIMANCVIENGAHIGNHVVLHPGVIIGYDCRLGDHVIVKSNTVIGSDGFGFAMDERKKNHRIPQTGRVRLEDHVEVGSCCCIDRATYKETVIGEGTKLDNHCHIAHNVQIGRDCLLTAGLVVAGSTKIGNRVVASGQTGILDHLEVADDITLVHRAGVMQDLPEPGGIYAGLPTQPLNQYMRNTALLHRLTEMRNRLRELEKKVEQK